MRATCLPILVVTLLPTIANAQTAADQAPPAAPGVSVQADVSVQTQPTPQPAATNVPPASATQPAMPPPPPGAAPTPYGQPAYGAPAYGQPMYGQPGYPQPGYGQYPPGYGYPQPYPPMRTMRRREVPYNGGPVPPGAVLETHRPMALVVGGGVLFVGAYLLTVLDATGAGNVSCVTASCGGSWLYVPIVGPWVTLGFGGHPTADSIFIGLDGVAQAAGLVGFVIGMASAHQVLVFNDYVNRDNPRRRADNRPIWAVTPGAPGAPVGATLSVLRF